MSLGLISLFTCIYFFVVIKDINYVLSLFPNIKTFPSYTKEAIFNAYMHIRLPYLTYEGGNWSGLIYDLFYFSSITFYTIGYGDILITGFPRIIAIIEGAFGVGSSAVFISYLLFLYTKSNLTFEKIKLRLNLGYEVLWIQLKRKQGFKRILSFKDIYQFYGTVTIIDKNDKLIDYNFQGDKELLNFLKEFSIQWFFPKNDILPLEYLFRFSLYLYTALLYTKTSYKYNFYNISLTSFDIKSFYKNITQIFGDDKKYEVLDYEIVKNVNNVYYYLQENIYKY